jgi:hypothetical protein
MQVSGSHQSSALCSDDSCPCGYPGATIQRGAGYIYTSREVADFRADCLTEAEARVKIDRLSRGAMMVATAGVFAPILMCEQGARKRGLDLDVATADARHWWETGMVPLRPTPLAGSSPFSNAAAEQAPAVRYTAPPAASPVSYSRPLVVPAAKTLRGFAKGWAIFWIVVNIAADLPMMGAIAYSTLPGLRFLVQLLDAAIAGGYFLLIKKNPVGLYAILAANLLIFVIGIVKLPGYAITVTTGLIPGILTYFITRSQIHYSFGGRR